MKQFFFLVFFTFLSHLVFAGPDTLVIPVYRQFFHDKIANEQKLCDKLDGKQDKMMRIGSNEELNIRLSDVLFRKIDALLFWIETNENISSNNDKIKLLNYVENCLRLFREEWSKKEITPGEFSVLIDNLTSIIKNGETTTKITSQVEDMPYSMAKIITETFPDNPGYYDAKKLVYYKYSLLHPDQILNTIRPYVNEPFSDSLIVLACQQNPVRLYNYAQSLQTPESMLIHRNTNSLVSTIAKISKTPNSLLYYPFLDDIISGKKSIEVISRYVGDGEMGFDSVGYYKLLVHTEMDYFKRMSGPLKDTPVAMFGTNGLREMLKDRAIRHFISPINELHNENNLTIRLKAIDSLDPVDLYYMMVMGENDIYTSSFKHSFSKMLQRMGTKPRMDSLLLSVRFDYFKKFIKMSANYNRLDTFLKCMPASSSQSLMKAFVANLDKSGSLEDATDVADSYSSINDIQLQNNIVEYIKENESKCTEINNQKGVVVYNLLKNIFLSLDSANHINLTEIANIPSVYEIDRAALTDDSGRIIQQVFFYGDEDGKTFFTPFLNSFSARDWKITRKDEWVEIRSVKGNMYVFANLPLDSDANLDDSAQVHLNKYLQEMGWVPKVVVHRGHSYWLPGTINRMPSNAKIVLIGSCGGYKNLNKILDKSPDAQIISTKEIGAGDINRPIMSYLNLALINDNHIVWREMWQSLSRQFNQERNSAVAESWESYIPPYRNLGAIFIKAYNRKMKTP